MEALAVIIYVTIIGLLLYRKLENIHTRLKEQADLRTTELQFISKKAWKAEGKLEAKEEAALPTSPAEVVVVKNMDK